MLKCQQIAELADRYLEGKMPLMQRVSYKVHLFMCKDCKNYINQLQIAIASIKNLASKPLELSDQATDEIFNQVVNK